MIPTECRRCGQKLFLLGEGRDVCERCRLGRTVLPEATAEPVDPLESGPEVPCVGCGRTTVEGHESLRVALADGYCLGCRVRGLHLLGG